MRSCAVPPCVSERSSVSPGLSVSVRSAMWNSACVLLRREPLIRPCPNPVEVPRQQLVDAVYREIGDLLDHAT